MGYVLPFLIMIFVLVVSTLDAIKKKQKGTPQVQSRPYLEDLASILENGKEEEPVSPGESPAPAMAEEGERAVHKAHQSEAPETENPEPKLRIDKKNLILYSEILKPKFDD